MKTSATTVSACAALALLTGSAQAATIALTSVDDLDFTNVVKAYDFTGTTSITNFGTSFDIGGVTFTRHRWQFGTTTFADMTMTGGHASADNQGSSAPNITHGGTATDRTNLNELLDWWNIGAAQDNSSVTLSIAVPDGTYDIQLIVGSNGSRENQLYDIDAGAKGSGNEVLLGSLGTTDKNVVITGSAVATGGTLDLLIFGTPGTGDGRPIVSGLMISQVPEPGSLALLGLGGLLIGSRRRRD